MKQPKKVKIVATLGPASEDLETLVSLIEAGLDVARLNFSHGNHDEHRRRFESLRAASERVGRPIAVLADLGGPKIRVGRLEGHSVELEEGAELELTNEDCEGSAELVPHTYDALAEDVAPGQLVFLDDGRLRLKVLSSDGVRVRCRVEAGGTLLPNKGINLPQTGLSTPALTDKDRRDLTFARLLGVDFVALSFVRTAADVVETKELAGSIPVIAKIERPEAVANLEAILDAADGVMVARGDLGVEVGHEKVPAIQRRIIREALKRTMPVITATQMLESMVSSQQPTRAEVSDVANAVLDGTDAVMLSGETAVGQYPIKTVAVMSKVIRETEQSSDLVDRVAGLPKSRTSTFSTAMAAACVAVSEKLGLTAIAVYSESGYSAADVSCLRPQAAVIAFSRHEKILRRLALYWGICPHLAAWVEGVSGVVKQAEQTMLELGVVEVGDEIAVTFSMVLDNQEVFQTNTMKLHKVTSDG